MTTRHLMIAAFSAALAFAGGYALLGSLEPAGARTQASRRPAADGTKVVATPGSALVPLDDGSNRWMLVGPDGTVLADADGRAPAFEAASAPASAPGAPVGGYLPGFASAYQVSYLTQEGGARRARDARGDHGEHDLDDHDDDDEGRRSSPAAAPEPEQARARSRK